MPVNKFSNVDLPLPDGPTIATNSPGKIARLISCKTVCGAPACG